MKETIIEFTHEPFTVTTKSGPKTIPAIACPNGIFVHRPICNLGPQEAYDNLNPSPHWTVSAKCGLRIKNCFIPHLSFNDFLNTIGDVLCKLDWTGTSEDVIASKEHKEAVSLFLACVMPFNGIDYSLTGIGDGKPYTEAKS